MQEVTVKEYSRILNISVQAVYQKINKGALKVVVRNNKKYIVFDSKSIKSRNTSNIEKTEKSLLKYFKKELKKINNKLDKKERENKQLYKQLLKSEKREKKVLLQYISEMKQLQITHIKENDIIDIKQTKKKKRKKKKR